MSDTWAADWRGEDDTHTTSCPSWKSNDPVKDCDCFQAGVERLVTLFESYAPKQDVRGDGAR